MSSFTETVAQMMEPLEEQLSHLNPEELTQMFARILAQILPEPPLAPPTGHPLRDVAAAALHAAATALPLPPPPALHDAPCIHEGLRRLAEYHQQLAIYARQREVLAQPENYETLRQVFAEALAEHPAIWNAPDSETSGRSSVS